MDSVLSPKHPVLTPSDNLFIYYLKGRVEPGTEPICRYYLGTWQEDDDAFLFFAAPSMEAINRLTGTQPRLDLIDSYQMTYAQWMGGEFDALEIGPFLITPPWYRSPASDPMDAGRYRIVLDPGVVFGSGLHTTTSDSLTAMMTVFRLYRIHTAVDIGCGTGLLALAAARLGCRRVLAMDYNRLAAQTACRNVRLNRLGTQVVVIQAKAETHAHPSVDLVMANIHYDVTSELIRMNRFYQNSCVIFSGLLRSQLNHLKTELSRRSVRLLSQWSRDGVWYTVLARLSDRGGHLQKWQRERRTDAN